MFCQINMQELANQTGFEKFILTIKNNVYFQVKTFPYKLYRNSLKIMPGCNNVITTCNCKSDL